MNWELKGQQELEGWANKGARSVLPFPEVIESSLEEGFAICCSFNPTGTLLATGCNDGRIVLWDFSMRKCAKILLGHVLPVTSLRASLANHDVITTCSWDHTGNYLASGSADWQVFVWDVIKGTRVFKQQFQAPVLKAQFHPTNSDCLLVCSLLSIPLLVNISTQKRTPLVVNPTQLHHGSTDDKCTDNRTEEEEEVEPHRKRTKTEETGVRVEGQGEMVVYHPNDIACFGPGGNRIYLAGGNGDIVVVKSHSLTVTMHLKVHHDAKIKYIGFSQDGSVLLINSSDRIIRTFDTITGKPRETFQDTVGRVNWVCCTLGNGSHFVVAGPSAANTHQLFIWEAATGMLLRVLQGPAEGILDVAWHPTQVVAVSISTAGVAYVWVVKYQDTWSNFDPTFTELENNEEYLEREDEFDQDRPEPEKKRVVNMIEEAVNVDVVESMKDVKGRPPSAIDLGPPGIVFGNTTFDPTIDNRALEKADALEAVGRAFVEYYNESFNG